MAESAGDQIRHLLTFESVRKALSDLGVFVRFLKDGGGISNYLWKSWGYSDEEMTEENWIRALHPDDREAAVENYHKSLTGEIESHRQTYRIRTHSDELRWVVTSGTVVAWDEEGRPEIYLGADTDITEKIRAQNALTIAKQEAEAEAQRSEALRMAGAIVTSTLDVDKTVQLVLDQASQVVPYDTATVGLLRDDAIEVIGGGGWDDLDAIKGLRIPYPGDNPFSKALESQQPTLEEDVAESFPRFANISGTEIRSWLGVPLIVHGEKIGLLSFDSDKPRYFTPHHVRLAAGLADHVAVALFNARLYEQTRELAMTDSLTGLATRRAFFVQTDHALEQARREGQIISVLMADVDHFKQINDKLGHAAGDEAIRRVADAVRAVVRKADILGRYGGEEFAIVLPNTDQPAAVAIAERLRSRIAAIALPGTDAPLSASIGLAALDSREVSSVDEMLDLADRGLYEAKRNGRDRVEIFRPE